MDRTVVVGPRLGHFRRTVVVVCLVACATLAVTAKHAYLRIGMGMVADAKVRLSNGTCRFLNINGGELADVIYVLSQYNETSLEEGECTGIGGTYKKLDSSEAD